jgi:Holliday junction resolvasome RuvABC endonuclease subunit
LKILSVDPSVAAIGVAEVTGGVYVNSYTVKTDAKDKLEDRLEVISGHFRGLTGEYDCVLIEQPGAFMRLGDYGITNVKSVQLLMLAIGVIYGTLAGRYKVEFVRVKDWKGRAGKKVTQMMAARLAGRKLNTHEADALIMALNWERYIKFNWLRINKNYGQGAGKF